ncbi:Bacterial extracellular solute-binding protein [Paenibacillus konkukensis]|uniref:Bacterial extracellular solute-binding protein n=1 Tax=Paenibacillus konkukensis TaxID=2020716 RepID=A0ABY4RN48_9BACL|nr:extracellular solute-binding protein [Paenibacillus konkukensis]UQZ83380.1 Bacterial extracellular solute-binding protein [Paenibacillus konkukensis]
MSWKNASLMLIIASLAASVTACSGGKGETAGTEPAPVQSKSNPSEPVELVVVSTSGDSEDSFNERFGNAIKSKFPNYTIKYIPSRKEYGIKEMLVAGQQMDLYFDSISFLTGGLLGNGLQYDMSDLIKQSNVDLGTLEPGTIEAMKQLSGGKMYGVPVFNNNVVMYYNKDLFDKSGVPYPKDGMTWSEFSDLVKKLVRNDGNKQYAGYAYSGTHVFRMNQLSLPYVDEKTGSATINDEQWKKFIQTVFLEPQTAGGWEEFVKATGKTPYTNEFFKTYGVATFALLSSSIFIDKNFETMNWDMVALPTFPDLPGVGSQPYPTYFSVTSNSQHKNEAMDVIAYLASDEMQTKLSKMGVMPAAKKEEIKQLFGTDSKFKDKNLKAIFYNQFAPIPYKSIYDLQLESPYTQAVGNALSGDMNTALRKAEEEANKRIQDAKAK